MAALPETPLPKSRSDVIFRPLDDSWVLFDPRAEQLHVLNLSAALVWAHLDGASSPEVIAEAVGSAFNPPQNAAQVLTDVLATLDRFREASLLEAALHG
ncbi:PqqD family protein [Gemmatimonadota bacterium]